MTRAAALSLPGATESAKRSSSTVGLRYPVTTIILVQYVPMAVLPAAYNSSQYLGFICTLVAVAAGAAFAVEFTLSRFPARDRATALAPVGRAPVLCVAWIGTLATVGAALLGAGTYETQIGAAATSPFAPLLTPLVPWALAAAVWGLWGYRQGDFTRRILLEVLVPVVLGQCLYVVITAITAPLPSFALAIFAAAMVLGLVRLRTLAVAALVAILLWPAYQAVRNENRIGYGGSVVAATQTVSALDRLREDLLLSQAAVVGDELDVPQASVADVVRYGLIPRALDPDRPPLPSGKLLNAALGGSARSSNTFTVIGNLYSLDGGLAAIAVYCSLLALWTAALVRRLSPLRLALFAITVHGMLWIEGIYPDSLIGLVQATVSVSLVWLLVRRSASLVASETQAQPSHLSSGLGRPR